MKFKLFLQAYLLALRQCVPLYLIVALIVIILDYIDSPTLYAGLYSIGVWMLIGSWVVFVKLKKPHHQSEDFFFLKASGKDLYWIVWWPWFVLHEFRRRRGNFR